MGVIGAGTGSSADDTASPESRWSRRRLLGVMARAALPAAVADAVGVEPYRLVVERVALAFPDLPAGLDGLRIAQVSDLHRGLVVRQWEIERATALTNTLGADLIVLTGDYVTAGVRYARPCAAALAKLHAPLGRYAVLGNHDHWSGARGVTRALERAGIPVLRNQPLRLRHRGADLWLVGVDDAYVWKHDLNAATRGVPPSAFKLALMHEPDLAEEVAGHGVQLQLSGHSHGGQVCLPGIGPLHLPHLGRRYPMGLYHIGQLQLYTNRGVGRVSPPIRFDCPPEITLITLRRA